METKLENYDDKVIDLKDDTVKTVPPKPKQKLTDIYKPHVEAFGLTTDVVKQNFLKAITKNPELKKATPETVFLGALQIVASGLSINPDDGEASLIPYKQGMTTVAQVQYQYKGLKRVLKRDIKGVIDVLGVPIKKGDIKTWNFKTGEADYNEEIFTNDFEKQRERRKLETIGYAGIILLDEKVFGAKNILAYMDLDDIAFHKEEYNSRTKISEHTYNTKTLIKKVYRDFKEVYKDRFLLKDGANPEAINNMLAGDHGVHTVKGVEYVEQEKGGQ